MKNQIQNITVRVARKLPVAADIAMFELVRNDGQSLPPFTAGAHIDVHVPSGHTRQYSLCNDPQESHRYQIAILNEPNSRGGSKGMHEQVHEGQELLISAPRNHFPLAPEARKSLLLAGGIGLTPLMSMASVLSRRAHPSSFTIAPVPASGRLLLTGFRSRPFAIKFTCISMTAMSHRN